jgi:signal transduction histidine kinase
VRLTRQVPGLRTLRSGGPSGLAARRLAPALLLPLACGAAATVAGDLGLAPPVTIVTVNAVAATIILIVLFGTTVSALTRTERREEAVGRAYAESDRAAALLRSMDAGVLVADRHGTVVDANPRWYELAGRTPAEVLGREVPDWPDGYVVRPDGSQVPVVTTRAPVPDVGTVRTSIDVSDRAKAEEALTEHVTALERANTELSETNRRLEGAATFKNDLMSLVSHEMSQPLSSSASLAELLADSWEQLDDATRLDLTVKIHRNTRRLVGMVNDMLLLFHLDSGTVTARRNPVPIAEVVDQVAAGLPSGVEIGRQVEAAADALVDRNHLEQIMTNLLANAVAYGEPPIEVVARQDGKTVMIMVTDHGSGIPDEIRQYLFDRAVRPKATGTGSGRGRGLGLFIARHLAEVNGGTIWYEAAKPHGARLVVRLEAP